MGIKFSFDVFIIVILTGFFCLGALNLDFFIFEKTHRALAEKVAEKRGLNDTYFQLSAAQDLEMIRSLCHYEAAYIDSLIDKVSETLFIPKMLHILSVAKVREVLNRPVIFPNLANQARMTAHFYIDVAKLRLWQSSPPYGPHAQRLCSRWRRRSS